MNAKAVGTTCVELVENHAVAGEGLREVLESYPDVQVVAEAADGEKDSAQPTQCEPNVFSTTPIQKDMVRAECSRYNV